MILIPDVGAFPRRESLEKPQKTSQQPPPRVLGRVSRVCGGGWRGGGGAHREEWHMRQVRLASRSSADGPVVDGPRGACRWRDGNSMMACGVRR